MAKGRSRRSSRDGARRTGIPDRRQRAHRLRRSGARRQTLLVYGPDGERVARYDKIHLFRFTHGDEDYDEAKTIVAGARRPLRRTVRAGRAVDLLRPALSRSSIGRLATGAGRRACGVHGATGEAHWETLLRARAIENQCYVLAAAQAGAHPGGRRTWGHSMLVDPWGVGCRGSQTARIPGRGHRRRANGGCSREIARS